ncbi:MAG: PIN domain-containing protein [Candidatus Dormibacteraceae bacterium]
MNGATFDTGGLIAIDRGRFDVAAFAKQVLDRGYTIAIPAPVLSQAWRDGATQVRLARFLALEKVEVVPITEEVAKRVGEICRQTGTSDIVDVSVIWCAHKHRHTTIVTSDPGDMSKIDPQIELLTIGKQ